jgi:FkbM family methyltransferase
MSERLDVELYWSHSFLPNLVRGDGLVFDSGVNNGGSSRLLAARCHQVIGFEPDPRWQGAITLPDNVTVIPKTLSATRGRKQFYLNPPESSSLQYEHPDVHSVEVETLTLADAFAFAPVGRIDLLKMDIEGDEVDVLNDFIAEQASRTVQMSVEFHDFLDPSSVPAIRAVIDRLKQLRFHVVRFSWRNYGHVLFINQNLVPISVFDRIWLRVRHKYCRGVSRRVQRALNFR